VADDPGGPAQPGRLGARHEVRAHQIDARFGQQVKDWVDRNDALPRNANRPAAESKMAASGFGFGDLGGFRTSRF
jgi:hypothetical protein